MDSPATGRQLSMIAKLCSILHIRELVEESPMTVGQAGRLIRIMSIKIRSMKDAKAKRTKVL